MKQAASQKSGGSRLAGRVAVVTGAASGIGRAITLMFAREGALVVGADIDPVGSAETQRLATAEGLDTISLLIRDMTKPSDVTDLMQTTVTQHGGIDILVNAGAFGAFAWIEEMDYETQWKRTLTGELDVVFLACQAVWPHMKARGGGSIINFASANAWIALGTSPALAHCAGKGGVLAMNRQLAMEGGPHGIRANTISPGLIQTSATQAALDHVPGFKDEVLRKTMIKRVGQGEDIGWCAVYLASDEAAWVTGTDINVDGGATAW